MRVLVGSTRPAKLDGVRDALAAIAGVDPRFVGCIVEPHDLTEVAPRMPMSIDEIVLGARTRAAALMHRSDLRAAEAWNPATEEPGHRDTYWVGVEGGLHQLGSPTGDWALQSWAAVTDGTKWSFGAGPSLTLPPAIARRVVAGEELGDVIDGLSGAEVRGTRGAWGVLTGDLIGRRDAFRLAVLAAFAPFYNPAAWK